MGGLRPGGGGVAGPGRQKVMLLIKAGRPTDSCLIAFIIFSLLTELVEFGLVVRFWR